MLTITNTGAAGATMTSREDATECHLFAKNFYPKVFADIASMSREEMAMILHGLACKTHLIRSEWEFRTPYGAQVQSECPSVASIFAALEDYKHLAFIDDCRHQLEAGVGGAGLSVAHVYVAEFSDGHTKIGYSINPAQRLKSVAGANQASMLRSWASPGLSDAPALESRAHRHFKSDRVGGEFFRTPFDVAVQWISNAAANIAASQPTFNAGEKP